MIFVKINELSALTGVNIETIRKYRQKNLLHPRKLPNGYYDYSVSDLRELLFIRKLRESNFRLETIALFYEHKDRDQLLGAIQSEIDAMDAKILQLQNQKRFMQITMGHYQFLHDGHNPVLEVDVPFDTCAIPIDPVHSNSLARSWIRNMGVFAECIHIEPAIFRGEKLPEQIPFSMRLNSFRNLLEELGIEIPETAILIPKGKFLTIWIKPEKENSFSSSQLRPLLNYAAEHGYRLTGESAGFLYRVDMGRNEPRFIYSLRFRVETSKSN